MPTGSFGNILGGNQKEQLSLAFNIQKTLAYNPTNAPTFNFASPNSQGSILDLVSNTDPSNENKQTSDLSARDEGSLSAAVGIGAGSVGSAASLAKGDEANLKSVDDASGGSSLLVIGLALAALLLLRRK